MRPKNAVEEAARELVVAHLAALGKGGDKAPTGAEERAQWTAELYSAVFDVVKGIHARRGTVTDLEADRAVRLAGEWLREAVVDSNDARTTASWLGALYDGVLSGVVAAHAAWGGKEPGEFGVIRLTTDFIDKHAIALKTRERDVEAIGKWIGTFYMTICEGVRAAVQDAGATNDSAWTAFLLTAAVSPLPGEHEVLDARQEGKWVADLYRTILASVHRRPEAP